MVENKSNKGKQKKKQQKKQRPISLDYNRDNIKEVDEKFVVIVHARVRGKDGKIRTNYEMNFYDGLEFIKALKPEDKKQGYIGTTIFEYEVDVALAGKKLHIKASIEAESLEERIDVLLPVKKPELSVSPKDSLVFSGGEIKFKYLFGSSNVVPYWRIVGYTHRMGMIDAKTGVYQAPAVIPEKKVIEIEFKDLADKKTARAEIAFMPIKITANKAELQRVNVGMKKVQLNIQSDFDLKGLRNFSCQIITSYEIERVTEEVNGKKEEKIIRTEVPVIGSVEDGGLYTPPAHINIEHAVKVLAVSKTDPTKFDEYEFEVGFPFCHSCGKEVNSEGVCPHCNEPNSFVAYLLSI